MPTLPSLSVVMPVFNAGPYLDASVESILAQTHGDFEFVIRDDGSTDGSTAALRAWASRDERIRLFEGDGRLGPVGSSNWVVERSRGELVARMDGDDVAHPDRLRRQLDVLRADPDIHLVGTLWQGIDERGRSVTGRHSRWRLTRGSPFAPFPHPSIMFRRAAFDRAGGYREACAFWEDVDLYLRLAAHGRIAVLPEALLQVRHTRTGARLAARDSAEDAYHRMYSCLAEWERSGSYDPVAVARGPVTPQAVTALAAVELWAGGRPRVVGRLRRRSRLRRDLSSARAVAWAVWAGMSPATLRATLRAAHRARDLTTARHVREGQVLEWSPGRPPRAIG